MRLGIDSLPFGDGAEAMTVIHPDLALSPASAEPCRSLFRLTLDALPDGVLLTSLDRRVLYANPAFARHWGIPAELMASRDADRLLRYVSDQLIDPEGFRREVERVHPTDEASEDELCFKDGRILSRRSLPFLEDGVFQARIWIFTDITDAHSSSFDALTGLPNRRAFSREFPGFVEAPDDGMIRAVAIMDIDNFKGYNDRYGHAAGDTVLHQIGGLLRGHLRRADDLVFRIGGEEFLMASKAPARANAEDLFEAVRRSIAEMALPHAGNPPHGIVTASLGVCLFQGPRISAAVFAGADAALYRAKAAGRDAVHIAAL